MAVSPVEDLVASCPSAANVAAIDARLTITFDADPTAGTDVCGTTQLRANVYRTLLVMQHVNLARPLPWTSSSALGLVHARDHGDPLPRRHREQLLLRPGEHDRPPDRAPPRGARDALGRSRPRRDVRPARSSSPTRRGTTKVFSTPARAASNDADLGRARRLGSAVRARALARPVRRLVLRRSRSAAREPVPRRRPRRRAGEHVHASARSATPISRRPRRVVPQTVARRAA